MHRPYEVLTARKNNKLELLIIFECIKLNAVNHIDLLVLFANKKIVCYPLECVVKCMLLISA